jgi:hypothetical protein
MDSMRAERVCLLLVRQLPKSLSAYYKRVDESTEEQIPSSRVLKIEQLEPLGLAVQMYCLYLRIIQDEQIDADRTMAVAWRALGLAPEVRDDVVAQARAYYDSMLAYSVFHATSTVTDMVLERCEAILPAIAQAPELRDYVLNVAGCLNLLQQFSIA